MYNPPNTHYSHANFSSWNLTTEQVNAVMGPSGNNFKSLTTECEVKYIWWNDSLKVIEIWGPEDKLWNAREKVIEHVIKTISQPCFKYKYCEIEDALVLAE